MPNPTIVSASLDDKELQQSIANLVAHVKRGLHTMLTDTNSTVDAMEKKLKSLGNLKIDSGGSADGGASKRAKAQNAETDAVEKTITARGKQIKQNQEAAMSFDQIAAALDKARRTVSDFNTKRASGILPSSEDYKRYEQSLARIVEYNDKLKSSAMAMATANEKWFGGFSAKRVNEIFFPKDNGKLAAMSKYYADLEQQSQKTAQSAQRYTEQTEKGNRALQEQKEHLERIKDIAVQARKDIGQYGFANITNYRGVVYAENDERAKGLTIEQQIEKIIQEENAARNAQLGTEKQITQEIEQRGKKYVSPNAEINTAFNRMVANKIGLSEQDINNTSTKISALTQYIKQLEQAWSKMTDAEKNSPFGRQLRQELQYTTRLVQQARTELTRPINLKDALSGSEKTLDDIAYKMQRLRAYKQGIDLTKPNATNEIKQVDEALAKLQKDADKWMSKSQQMIKNNTALGRSWNYMKNRLAFYFTVGAGTSFIKQLVEIRSQYEMNERALGILINSAERGTQIFNELSSMALVSPYTLIELSTAAKQLTAYDVAAKDVVDTTRRLADMAAAVGIPIERLTYALGQIKAYGYLNSRDQRMFANAGIPLVKQLSDYYTELEGRLVSTADVYDRIKKKAIDYNDVMSVMYKMTDEGGKFFDFQAKMADTLKVQLANLTLAWNNMLNDIGESSQGLLTGGLKAMKELFLHWKQFNKIANDMVAIVGTLAATHIMMNVVFGKSTSLAIARAVAMRKVSQADAQAILSAKNLSASQLKLLVSLNRTDKEFITSVANLKKLTMSQIQAAMKANVLKTSWYAMAATARLAATAVETLAASLMAIAPQIAVFAVTMAVVDLIQTITDGREKVKDLNRTIVDNAKESAKAIKETIDTLNESGVNKDTVSNLSVEEQKKAWDEIRERIELSSASSEKFISMLMKEADLSKRVALGLSALESIEKAHDLMALWHDDTIEVSEDFKILGIGADGLTEDLSDFVKYMNQSSDSAGELIEKSNTLEGTWRQILSWVYDFSDLQAYLGFGTLDPSGWLKNIGDWMGFDFLDSEKAKFTDAYKEVQSEIDKTYKTLYNQIEKDGVKSSTVVYEMISKTISNIATERKWSEQETLTARLLLEQKFAESDMELFRKSVEGKNTAWEAWMNYLTKMHKTEFAGMANEEITKESWAQDKRRKLYEQTFEKFKEYNALAYEQLKATVNEASQLQVHIRVFYDKQNEPTDVEKDFKARTGYLETSGYYNDLAKGAKSQVDIVDKAKKAQKEKAREVEIAEKAGLKYSEENLKRLKKENEELITIIHSYGALTDAEEKANNNGSKKDPMLDTLKQTVDIVKKLQSEYDTLTKSGASSADALDDVRKRYSRTIAILNNSLQGYGLPQLNLEMIKGRNPNDVLEYFQKISDILTNKGLSTLERQKAVEVVIQEFSLKAKTYNLDMITKGLNNELGKLKDEYELAVELDADPELGSIFADYMGIDLNELPKNAEEAAKKAQQYIDKILRENKSKEKIDISSLMGKDAFDKWIKSSGHSMEDGIVKVVDNYRQALHKMQVDESKKQMQEWDKLLEKYAEYEYKVTLIQKEAEREREIARKKGASQEIVDAINERERQELARVSFEEFQKSPEWIVATGDLANMSKSAIGMLVAELERYKKSAKNLSPKQIKQLNSALGKLYKEQRKNNPFKAISNMLDEAKERMSTFDEDINKTQEEIDKLTKKKKKSIVEGIADEETDGKLKVAIERLRNLKKKQEEVGKVDASSWVSSINETIGAVKEAIGVFDDLAKAIGGVNGNSDIDKVFSVLESAGSAAATGAQIGGAWGAAIGAVVGAATSLVSIFAGSSNEKITSQIEKSELAVKKLELAYIDLQKAVDKAYGTSVIGAKTAAAAAKKLELQELERQLRLERSRDSKYRDESRIVELQKQIKELKYEIQDTYTEIVNDLMGTDVGSFAENLVSAMVDAFKQGEDAMKVFNDKFDELIDNMIMKSLASRIVSSYIDKLWEEQEQKIKLRSTKEADELAKAQAEYDKVKNMSEMEWLMYHYGTNKTMSMLARAMEESGLNGEELMEYLKNLYEHRLDAVETMVNNTQKTFDDATSWTNQDTNEVISGIENLKDGLYDNLYNAISQWYTFGQDSDKNLSNLQQGIQSITEDTAGALEAITNGISQQCYLQSDILIQIRDTVQSFDIDIQTASLSQILLQLQSSYQLQQSMLLTMENWTNQSGNAVRVELIS